MSWTYNSDEGAQRKEGGVFGLNTKAKFDTIEVSESKNGNVYFRYVVKVKERTYNGALFDPTQGKVFYNGKEIDPTHPDYEKAITSRITSTSRIVTHILKAAGVNPKSLEEEFKDNPASDFEEFLRRSLKYLPADYKDHQVDVFLQWMRRPTKEGRRFLEIPDTLTYGYFVVKHVEPQGEWKEERTSEHLKYVDNEGNVHPIKRDSFFLSKPMAKDPSEDAEKGTDEDSDLPFGNF